MSIALKKISHLGIALTAAMLLTMLMATAVFADSDQTNVNIQSSEQNAANVCSAVAVGGDNVSGVAVDSGVRGGDASASTECKIVQKSKQTQVGINIRDSILIGP